jgi:hypothetical protein
MCLQCWVRVVTCWRWHWAYQEYLPGHANKHAFVPEHRKSWCTYVTCRDQVLFLEDWLCTQCSQCVKVGVEKGELGSSCLTQEGDDSTSDQNLSSGAARVWAWSEEGAKLEKRLSHQESLGNANIRVTKGGRRESITDGETFVNRRFTSFLGNISDTSQSPKAVYTCSCLLWISTARLLDPQASGL